MNWEGSLLHFTEGSESYPGLAGVVQDDEWLCKGRKSTGLKAAFRKQTLLLTREKYVQCTSPSGVGGGVGSLLSASKIAFTEKQSLQTIGRVAEVLDMEVGEEVPLVSTS